MQPFPLWTCGAIVQKQLSFSPPPTVSTSSHIYVASALDFFCFCFVWQSSSQTTPDENKDEKKFLSVSEDFQDSWREKLPRSLTCLLFCQKLPSPNDRKRSDGGDSLCTVPLRLRWMLRGPELPLLWGEGQTESLSASLSLSLRLPSLSPSLSFTHTSLFSSLSLSPSHIHTLSSCTWKKKNPFMIYYSSLAAPPPPLPPPPPLGTLRMGSLRQGIYFNWLYSLPTPRLIKFRYFMHLKKIYFMQPQTSSPPWTAPPPKYIKLYRKLSKKWLSF